MRRLNRDETRAKNRLRNSIDLRRRVLVELNRRLKARGDKQVNVDAADWQSFWQLIKPYLPLILSILLMFI